MIFEPSQLHATLNKYLSPEWKGETLWVAYSGGLDSSVLLHALHEVLQPSDMAGRLKAIHINHGLSVQSDDWQLHCEQKCNSLGIELKTATVEVVNQGKGIEAEARKQRYRVFSNLIQVGDCLLLAHHQDDQAETLLFRLLRGAGIKGLAAMPELKAFAKGHLLRPLLGFSRQSLLDYAKQQHLSWIEDESNQAQAFDRNFLRQTILPSLEQRWGNISKRLSKTAARFTEADEILQEVGRSDLIVCGETKARLGYKIERQSFSGLSVARRHNLLRAWCIERHLPLPDFKHLEILDSAMDQDSLFVQWSGCEIRTYQESLYLLPRLKPQDLRENNLNIAGQPGEISLPNGTLLEVSRNSKRPGADIDDFKVRFRKGGERCRPAGRGHSQTLKKLLQEYSVEPWLRDQVPLIYCGEDLVAVAGYWVCSEYEHKLDDAGLQFDWRFIENQPQY